MKHLFFGVVLLSMLTSATLNAQTDTDSISKQVELEEIIVQSSRIKNPGTLSSQKFSQSSLKVENTGVNLPYLLLSSPSLVVTSDDGLGIGYTYFRVRGTDQSRINMTVNGIPLNDSESQTVFWVNMTDMVGSMQSVDVQRGVGTSSNGSAAFGASVNLQSQVATLQPYAELRFNGGMYNTFRETAKIGTGLINNHFAFDARFSKVNSDGYLRRASSDLYSYYAAGTYYGATTVLKLMAFGGKERTYMAWDGVTKEQLQKDRRYNPAGSYTDDNGDEAFYKDQTDNYAQQHYQLHLTQQLPRHWNLNAALHYTLGDGYYEQYKTGAKFKKYGIPNGVDTLGQTIKKSDLVRQKHLHNHFYGGIFAANYTHNSLQATIGGGANNYHGSHYGNILWIREYNLPLAKDYEYYRNHADKLDANVYGKINWDFYKGLSVYADMQYRYINYTINGINDEDLKQFNLKREYNFFNPKAGLSYVNDHHKAYFNFAIANREPSRKNFTEAGPNEVPNSERLFDYELGYQYSNKMLSTSANLYFMDYDNQLVLTGRYSDTGAALTTNVKDSYRAGIELMFGIRPVKWFQWDLNMTLSRNKILNFTDWVDDSNADWDNPDVIANNGQVKVDYGTTDISFSPSITAGSTLRFMVAGFNAILQTNYVGKQYLNNTMNNNAKLNPYCVSNLNLSYSIPVKKVVKELVISAQLNNLFNALYVSNGGVYNYYEGANADGKYLPGNEQSSPWFYAQAGFNIHAGFSVLF